MEPINNLEDNSARLQRMPLLHGLPNLVERREFFQQHKHAQSIQPGDPELLTVSELLERFNSQGRNNTIVDVDAPTRDEIKNLLRNPQKLVELDRKYRTLMDRDKDGFLSNVELVNAISDRSLPRDARLLAAALSEGYNGLIDLSQFGDQNNISRPLADCLHPRHRGIHKEDIIAFARAKDYESPHWLSPMSSGFVGTTERYAVLGAGWLAAGLLAYRFKLGPLSELGLTCLGSVPWMALNKKAVAHQDLLKRHERIQEMLKRLD